MTDDGMCDRCIESLNAGHNYCVKCGRPTGLASGTRTAAPSDTAVAQDAAADTIPEAGAAPCSPAPIAPAVPAAGGSTFMDAVRIIGTGLLFICAVFLCVEIYGLFWTFFQTLPDVGSYPLPLIIIFPDPMVLFWMTGSLSAVYYLFLTASVLVSFFFVFYRSREGVVKGLFRNNLGAMDDTPLYSVATLFAATISFNLIFNLIVMLLGYSPTVPDFSGPPFWYEWWGFLNASVWEEVLCRVLMIGVPLMLIGLLMNKTGSWKRIFGHFDMDKFALLFIFISALLFSYAHVAGWDAFKMIPTFATGLALGYLFVKYGIYASIMMHFLIDYLLSITWISGGTLESEAAVGMFLMFIAVVGMIFMISYAVRGTKYVVKKMSEGQQPLQPFP